MDAYLSLLSKVLKEGCWQNNRTGVRTMSLPGAMLRFDLQEGFPAITTRKLAFKSAMGELVGFLRGYCSAADFRELGCKVWDQNANENQAWLNNPHRAGKDDLGPIYGVQWRRWPAYKWVGNETSLTEVDQLRECLDLIRTDPTSRRIIFHAWNPAQLDEMALPPCHLLYQFLVDVEHKELSMCLYVRSNDLVLGAPFNIAEGAALMHLVGRLTGYTPRWFNYLIGDAHIYETHLSVLTEQLQREPLPLPKLAIADRVPTSYAPEWLDKIEPSDFCLLGYRHHPHLTAPMAV